MASRSFRCTKTSKENPMKSERYKGVSGEQRTVPGGNVSSGRNLGQAVSLDSTACAEVPGESRRGTLRACATTPAVISFVCI